MDRLAVEPRLVDGVDVVLRRHRVEDWDRERYSPGTRLVRLLCKRVHLTAIGTTQRQMTRASSALGQAVLNATERCTAVLPVIDVLVILVFDEDDPPQHAACTGVSR